MHERAWERKDRPPPNNNNNHHHHHPAPPPRRCSSCSSARHSCYLCLFFSPFGQRHRLVPLATRREHFSPPRQREGHGVGESTYDRFQKNIVLNGSMSAYTPRCERVVEAGTGQHLFDHGVIASQEDNEDDVGNMKAWSVFRIEHEAMAVLGYLDVAASYRIVRLSAQCVFCNVKSFPPPPPPIPLTTA